MLLLALAVAILLAPFKPAPRVWEKLAMQVQGRLRRLLDIFDLFYHLLPTVLLVIRGMRLCRRRVHPGDRS